MEPRDKEKLQRHYSSLIDVIYSSISPHLISKFVITMDMHEEIDSRPTERKKMEKLISILPSRGEKALRELINSLKPSYSWIANKLERECVQTNTVRANVLNNNRHLIDCGIGNYVRNITQILQRNPRASSHWTFLANSMSLMPTTIMDIKREMMFSGGCEYAIFALLEAWVTMAGNSQATFSKLISLLQREGMNQCAEEVGEFWATLEYSGQLPDRSSSTGRSRSPVITNV